MVAFSEKVTRKNVIMLFPNLFKVKLVIVGNFKQGFAEKRVLDVFFFQI